MPSGRTSCPTSLPSTSHRCPPPTALPSTAQLKIRVIKATLDFLVSSLGPKDRLSLVTFEVGVAGQVRKCPFLCVGKAHSRQRLDKFIDSLGVALEENQDEFLVRGSKDEKTDVVTAVNHGTSLFCFLAGLVLMH